jgi:hypothetical protein
MNTTIFSTVVSIPSTLATAMVVDDESSTHPMCVLWSGGQEGAMVSYVAVAVNGNRLRRSSTIQLTMLEPSYYGGGLDNRSHELLMGTPPFLEKALPPVESLGLASSVQGTSLFDGKRCHGPYYVEEPLRKKGCYDPMSAPPSFDFTNYYPEVGPARKRFHGPYYVEEPLHKKGHYDPMPAPPLFDFSDYYAEVGAAASLSELGKNSRDPQSDRYLEHRSNKRARSMAAPTVGPCESIGMSLPYFATDARTPGIMPSASVMDEHMEETGDDGIDKESGCIKNGAVGIFSWH